MGKAEYWHNAGRRIPFIICAVLTAVLLFSAVGYATSYQATTEVTGNSIDVDYITLAAYSYNYGETTPDVIENINLEDFTPSGVFVNEIAIKYYKHGENNYTVEYDSTVTEPNCYLIPISNKAESLNMTVSLTSTITDSDMAAYFGNDYSIRYSVGGSSSTGVSISTGNAYRISVDMCLDHVDTTAPSKTNLPVNLIATATVDDPVGYTGACVENKVVTVELAQSAADLLASLNSFPINGVDIESSPNTYDGADAARLYNEDNSSHGIGAHGSGKIDVSFKVPSNMEFIIVIRFTQSNQPQNLHVTVKTVDGDSVEHTILDGNGAGYIQGVNTGTRYVVSSVPTTSDQPAGQVSEAMPTGTSTYWLKLDGVITITLGAGGSDHISDGTTLDVVLKQ